MEKIQLEHEESSMFSNWLKINGIKHHHGNDNMYTKSWNQKRKMKEVGFSKGFPDFMCIVPEEKSFNKKSLIVFIEMKRRKLSNTSIEQKEWIEEINKVDNVGAYVAKGANEAIDIIKSMLL